MNRTSPELEARTCPVRRHRPAPHVATTPSRLHAAAALGRRTALGTAHARASRAHLWRPGMGHIWGHSRAVWLVAESKLSETATFEQSFPGVHASKSKGNATVSEPRLS